MIPTVPGALLLLIVKATAVLVAALALTRVLQRAPAGARHLVWLATLGALLLVPALGAWGPLRIAVLPALAPTVQASATATPQAGAARQRFAPPASGAPGVPAPAAWEAPNAGLGVAPPAGDGFVRRAADAVRAVPAAHAALGLWAAVALAVGASLAASWLAVRRIVRRARPLDGPDWLGPLYEIADRLGLEEPPRLLRSADARMPFACGLRRPTVVLPAACDAWAPDRRRAVLLHELAHVRRRDLAGHTLARLVCAVYWFHPLVWTAAKRLRAESERACDDLALASGARASDYAEHLLEIVTSARRDATPAAALAMARRAEFEGRMLDILDPERPRAAPGRRQTAALVGVLALVTVVVGAAVPAPAATAAADPLPAAAAAERRMSEASRVEADERDEPRASAPAPPPTRAELRAPGRVVLLEAGLGGQQDTAARATDGATDVAEAPGANVAVEAEARAAASARAVARAAFRDFKWRGTAPERAQHQDERADLLARVLRADTSASLRRIAAWGLAEYAERPAAAAALAAALRADASAAVREMAAWALAEADGAPAAGDALDAALRADADPAVRATAAWALGNAGDESAAGGLAAALGDRSPEVRARAAWALGNVEPRRAPRALLAALGDAEPRVRELAAWALFNIEDPAAAPALQAALRAERDPSLQVAYVRALAAMGEQSVDALRGLLDSPDPRLKAVAVRALAGGHAAGPWPRPWPQPRPFP